MILGLTCFGLGMMRGLLSNLSSIFSTCWFSIPSCKEGVSLGVTETGLGIPQGQVLLSGTLEDVSNNPALSVGGGAAEGDPVFTLNMLSS